MRLRRLLLAQMSWSSWHRGWYSGGGQHGHRPWHAHSRSWAATASSLDERSYGQGPMTFHAGTEERLIAAVHAALATADGVASGPDRAERVIQAADAFCWKDHWMMLVGDEKGAVMDEALNSRVRETAVAACGQGDFLALELGTYVGYSAVRLARILPPGGRLVSCDPNQHMQALAQRLLSLAGISTKIVELVNCTAAECIELLRVRGERLDFVFIDHDKADYFPSLLRLEAANMLKPGAVIVADNVAVFGINDYLEHVRKSGTYSSQHVATALEYTHADLAGNPEIRDGVEISRYRVTANTGKTCAR